MGLFGSVGEKAALSIEKKKINKTQQDALQLFVECESVDPWTINVGRGIIKLQTEVDNGEMLDFLIQIGINSEDVIWEDGEIDD